MPLLLRLTLLFIAARPSPGAAARKTPVYHAISAWAHARKLVLDHAGSAVRLKAIKPHCYDGVELTLRGHGAKANGKDGLDCGDAERFELFGYERDGASAVWLVTFDSAYSSNIAAYVLKDGKLRPDARTSAALPTARDLLPKTLDADSEEMQRTLRSIEAHYYLDESGLRAELDPKQLDALCGRHNLGFELCKSGTPRVIVLKWNKAAGAFETDAEATVAAATRAATPVTVANAGADGEIAETAEADAPRLRPLE
jgi:hypothetical protein